MKNILKIAGWIILAVLMIDALGFVGWVLSGQTPVDSFYIGAITANVLQVIIN